MNIEPCEWKPKYNCGRRPGPLRAALLALNVGEAVMVRHEELACKGTGCGVSSLVNKLNTDGRRYESYHESPHVAVVRRVA